MAWGKSHITAFNNTLVQMENRRRLFEQQMEPVWTRIAESERLLKKSLERIQPLVGIHLPFEPTLAEKIVKSFDCEVMERFLVPTKEILKVQEAMNKAMERYREIERQACEISRRFTASASRFHLLVPSYRISFPKANFPTLPPLETEPEEIEELPRRRIGFLHRY